MRRKRAVTVDDCTKLTVELADRRIQGRCEQCGAPNHEPCDDCGQIVHIGDWPYCPHGRAQRAHGFEPYFDYGLGRQITTRGDVLKALRPHWENDHIVSRVEH